MKRVLVYTIIQISCLFSALAQRGRLSQDEYDELNHSTISGNGSLVLGILFICAFVALLFSFYLLWKWAKTHKEKVYEVLGSIICIAIVGICVFVAYKISPLVFNFISSKISFQQETTNVCKCFEEYSDIKNNRECVTKDEFNRNRGNIRADAWANYPPPSFNQNRCCKENDFFVAVVNNPSFSIYDLIEIAGLDERNTQFLSYSDYSNSRFIRERYTPETLRIAYNKLQYAWTVLKRYQYSDLHTEEIRKYMFEYNMFDTRRPHIQDASNPQMIKELKMKPLD